MRKSLILVADDESDLRKNVRIRLENHNFDVEEADGGHQTVARAISNPPDLLLLDIWMPDFDGRLVLRTLRLWEGTADLPVVMLTALRDKEAVRSSFSGGASHYIAKPFEPAKMLEIIRENIRPREQRTLVPMPLAWEKTESGNVWRIGPFPCLNAITSWQILRLITSLHNSVPEDFLLDLRNTEIKRAGVDALIWGEISRFFIRSTNLTTATGEGDALARLRELLAP